MTVTGFFHAGVTVSDMDASLRFYRDGLGLEPMADGHTGGASAQRIWNFDPGRVRVVFLKVPGSDAVVELFEFPDVERHSASARPCDYGAGHFCLYVDDAEGMYARLQDEGFGSRSGEVVTINEGRWAGAKAIYLKDPDGYHVELFQKP
jgi:catechol 2,3-dioxygenase-like lactoylglutathione lyase family enzyme